MTSLTDIARKMASTGGTDRFTAIRMEDAFATSAAEAFVQRMDAMERGDFEYAERMSYTQAECNARARANRFFLAGFDSLDWDNE